MGPFDLYVDTITVRKHMELIDASDNPYVDYSNIDLTPISCRFVYAKAGDELYGQEGGFAERNQNYAYCHTDDYTITIHDIVIYDGIEWYVENVYPYKAFYPTRRLDLKRKLNQFLGTETEQT